VFVLKLAHTDSRLMHYNALHFQLSNGIDAVDCAQTVAR